MRGLGPKQEGLCRLQNAGNTLQRSSQDIQPKAGLSLGWVWSRLYFSRVLKSSMGFPGGSVGTESICNAGDMFGKETCSGRTLEKGMATHSSILSWRVPWTEEPSGLQSVGSQRVQHN